MLPESEDRPSILSQFPCVSLVPLHVVFNFVSPEFFCRLFLCVIFVTVPEIPVTKYDDLFSPVYKVWISIHLWMFFKLESCLFQNIFHFDLYLCIFAPYSGHDPRTFLFCEYVRQMSSNVHKIKT